MNNTTRIERQGITVLESALLKSPRLKPEIDKNDKTESWDGFIHLYDDGSRWEKSKLTGRIPIQVKSTKNQIYGDETTFAANLSDLWNYYNEGGVVFFLICLDCAASSSHIFYAKLLREELDDTLKQKNAQKTVSIKLISFPTITEEMEKVFSNFIKEHAAQLQYSLLNGSTDVKSNVEITQLVFQVNDFGKLIMESPLYNRLLEWIARGATGEFEVIIEVPKIQNLSNLLAGFQRKIDDGKSMSEEEENEYIQCQKEITRLNKWANLKKKACELFLRDFFMQAYCNLETKKDILGFISTLINYDYSEESLRRWNNSEYILLDFTVRRKITAKEYYFVAPIRQSSLEKTGVSSSLGFFDVCLLSIDRLDIMTTKEIMMYYYLDLSREILYGDSSIETDRRAMNLLNYSIGLH